MTQAEVYKKIKEMGEGVTAREIKDDLKIGTQSLYRNLRDLQKNGRISAEGTPKRYYLT